MRRALLTGLALALLAGCGGSPDKEAAAPTTSGSPSASATAPAGAWSQAKSVLLAGRGRLGDVTTQISLGPRGSLAEAGRYTIGPDSSSIQRTTRLVDPATGKASTQVLGIRRTADNSNFVLQPTGASAGCWVAVDASDLERDSSGQSPLPGAVLVLQSAQVENDPAATGKPLTVPAQVPGLIVLQFLGFSLDEVDAAAAAASSTTVPVTLRIAADGAPAGLSVDGSAVAAALAGADLPKTVGGLLPKMSGRASLTRLGVNPQITAPPAARLAAPQGTCKPKS